MNEFLLFSQTPIVQIIGWSLGVAGWIIGIVSGVIQIRSYSEQKALEKGYLEILEQAKRDWQGKYTEEQIKDLADELSKLQTKIRQDIPQEAKRVYLENQRSALAESLIELYSQYSGLSNEVNGLTKGDLPPQLRDAIELAIMPGYRVREQNQKAVYLVIVLVMAILITLNQDVIKLWLSTPIETNRGRVNALGWILEYGLFIVICAFSLNKRFKNALLKWIRSKSEFVRSIVTFAWMCVFLLGFVLPLIVFFEFGLGETFPSSFGNWITTSLILFLTALPMGVFAFPFWSAFSQIPKNIFFGQKKQ